MLDAETLIQRAKIKIATYAYAHSKNPDPNTCYWEMNISTLAAIRLTSKQNVLIYKERKFGEEPRYELFGLLVKLNVNCKDGEINLVEGIPFFTTQQYVAKQKYDFLTKNMNLNRTIFEREFDAVWEDFTVWNNNKEDKKEMIIKRPEIKNVIFNEPIATIVYWTDGTKTVVKCNNETFDKEKGLAMAFIKKCFNDKGNFNNMFREWCD